MTDKATIQPKSKPEKTTISISGETSERLEIYCRANGILRKEFVSLALEYFERTGFDLKSNALDYSPLEKIIGELNEVKATMQTSNEGTEAIRQLLQAVREQTAKQLPAPELIAQATEAKAKAESLAAGKHTRKPHARYTTEIPNKTAQQNVSGTPQKTHRSGSAARQGGVPTLPTSAAVCLDI